MANEIFKELKTRIALRQNTYEYWTTGEGKDYIPLYGEICLCEIADGNAAATTAPTVLFKVGTAKLNADGTYVENTDKTFSELNWVSALAADVYAWAKAADVEFVDQKIRFKGADGSVIKEIDLSDFVTSDELVGITGALTALETESKATLVAAINEVRAAVQAGGTSAVTTIAKLATPTEGSQATYQLYQGGAAVGEKIEIPEAPVVNDATLDIKVGGGLSGTDVQFSANASENGEITISHGEKPTEGTNVEGTKLESATTFVTGVSIDEYGHVAGVTTADVVVPEIPDVAIADGEDVDVAAAATVEVIAELSAAGHTVTNKKAEVVTVYGMEENEKFDVDMDTVNSLGGIGAGEDLNGLTTHEILRKLLYPYVAQVVGTPTRTPNATVLEKGNNQVITAVSVAVTKKSEAITSVALYQGTTLLAEKTGSEVAAGGTFTFSNLSVAVPSTNVILSVKVTDASGNAVSKNTAAWTFVYPYYIGACAEGATINEALIEGLTKKIEAKGTKTHNFTCANQCMVFAYPKAYGALQSALDPNNFETIGSFTAHEVNVTGLDGTAQPYYAYVNSASTVTDFKMTFKY